MDDDSSHSLPAWARPSTAGSSPSVEPVCKGEFGPGVCGPGAGACIAPILATDGTPLAAPTPPKGHGLTVLVIEDDQDVRNVIRAILTAYGFGVLTAADGPAGLAIYREQGDRIKAVLTDLVMPDLQGAEVIAGLRGLNPAVRILAVTAMTNLKSLGITLEPGRLELLIKPMKGSELVEAIHHLLGRSVGPAPPITVRPEPADGSRRGSGSTAPAG